MKPPRLKIICATNDARIQTVYTVLRGELATTKEELQTSITALEKTATSHARGGTTSESSKSETGLRDPGRET